MKAFLSICISLGSLFSIWGQPPELSYDSPGLFIVNEPITPLLPNNSGGVIPVAPIVSTFAGTGAIGSIDGSATSASFNLPTVVAMDLEGNIIVVDRSNHKIRKITPEGTVSTAAGTGGIGAIDGPGNAATFRYPDGAVVDSQGNIFVSDQSNHKIRKIAPGGTVSTFAGSGVPGFLNGTGTSAKFYYPAGMAVDAGDNLYVADYSNNRIRKITPAGTVSTLAGMAAAGSADGNTASARFNGPTGVCLDQQGNVYVADYGNHKIRKIDIMGQVSSLAGTGTAGSTDALGISASFNHPAIVAADTNGNLYVTDEGNNKIRKISTVGQVTTFAGRGLAGATDGLADAASFNGLTGVAVASDRLLYIADYANHKIRKITTYGYTVVPDLPEGLILNPSTGEISGTPSQASSPNDYIVTATNQYGSSSVIINIEIGVLGNADFELSQLNVYPNPVTDILHVTGCDEIRSLTVYNEVGQEMKCFDGENANLPVDFSMFPTGIYLIKVSTDSGIKEITIVKE